MKYKTIKASETETEAKASEVEKDKNNPARSYYCRLCGYRWTVKGFLKPLRCPECESLDWEHEQEHFYCSNCKNRWTIAKGWKSSFCPRCGNESWDRGRERKLSEYK